MDYQFRATLVTKLYKKFSRRWFWWRFSGWIQWNECKPIFHEFINKILFCQKYGRCCDTNLECFVILQQHVTADIKDRTVFVSTVCLKRKKSFTGKYFWLEWKQFQRRARPLLVISEGWMVSQDILNNPSMGWVCLCKMKFYAAWLFLSILLHTFILS